MNKKQRILVLEDEAFIRNQIKEFLENQEYEVIAPKQPDCFEQWENEQQPDLILLDIGLGSQDGIQLCKRLRKDTQVPIAFVTGENTTQMEVQGLQAGGDDYIRKPFDFCVLLIRIQNLLKRARSEQDQLCVEGVVLDLVFGQLCYEDQCFELSKKELQILYYLFRNYPRIVGRDEMIEYLWENKLFVDENILNVNLSRIRKRLEGTVLENFVKTIPRTGYQIGGNQNEA